MSPFVSPAVVEAARRLVKQAEWINPHAPREEVETEVAVYECLERELLAALRRVVVTGGK